MHNLTADRVQTISSSDIAVDCGLICRSVFNGRVRCCCSKRCDSVAAFVFAEANGGVKEAVWLTHAPDPVPCFLICRGSGDVTARMLFLNGCIARVMVLSCAEMDDT